MLKTLVIDNYDSFVYNLVQYIWELGGNPVVFRNNEITLEQAIAEKPTHIVISPGPWDPTDKAYFWVCNDIILNMWKTIPLLWVCLGHQWIWACFWGKIIRSPATMHGKASKIIKLKDSKIFEWIDFPIEVMRYHSLAVDFSNCHSALDTESKSSKNKQPEIIITSQTEDNTAMSLEHTKYPIYWVQFHPESIGTPDGKKIIKNFLKIKV